MTVDAKPVICDACLLEVQVEKIADSLKPGLVTFGYVTGAAGGLFCQSRASDRKRYHVVDGRPAVPWSGEA